jgi:hypothetical protein
VTATSLDAYWIWELLVIVVVLYLHNLRPTGEQSLQNIPWLSRVQDYHLPVLVFQWIQRYAKYPVYLWHSFSLMMGVMTIVFEMAVDKSLIVSLLDILLRSRAETIGPDAALQYDDWHSIF